MLYGHEQNTWPLCYNAAHYSSTKEAVRKEANFTHVQKLLSVKEDHLELNTLFSNDSKEMKIPGREVP